MTSERSADIRLRDNNSYFRARREARRRRDDTNSVTHDNSSGSGGSQDAEFLLPHVSAAFRGGSGPQKRQRPARQARQARPEHPARAIMRRLNEAGDAASMASGGDPELDNEMGGELVYRPAPPPWHREMYVVFRSIPDDPMDCWGCNPDPDSVPVSEDWLKQLLQIFIDGMKKNLSLEVTVYRVKRFFDNDIRREANTAPDRNPDLQDVPEWSLATIFAHMTDPRHGVSCEPTWSRYLEAWNLKMKRHWLLHNSEFEELIEGDSEQRVKFVKEAWIMHERINKDIRAVEKINPKNASNYNPQLAPNDMPMEDSPASVPLQMDTRRVSNRTSLLHGV